MRLFKKKREGNPHRRFPEQYYETIWIDEQMSKGIDMVSKIEGISKKKAARLILESGFSCYMGDKLKEHVENRKRIREHNYQRQPYPTHFARVVRKFCETCGVNYGDFL